ncbi:hypothetical protein D3C72_1941800 [compost metagenome]
MNYLRRDVLRILGWYSTQLTKVPDMDLSTDMGMVMEMAIILATIQWRVGQKRLEHNAVNRRIKLK